ncbi:hypothetical protein TNCV_2759041 [Trichonephila clavipes]|nr:hypothetical protein TNCV_2759041 [Trichonephila clavipes]
MSTPMSWPYTLYYAGEDPWREQPDRDGPTDSRLGLIQTRLLARGERELVLFKPHTYTTSCMTLCIVLLVDVIILRKNSAYTNGHGPKGQIRTCIGPLCLPQ